MNCRDFFNLVDRMREAQQAYFKTRDHNSLLTSKALEAEVDQARREIHKMRERAKRGQQGEQQQQVPTSFFETPANEVEGWIGHA